MSERGKTKAIVWLGIGLILTGCPDPTQPVGPQDMDPPDMLDMEPADVRDMDPPDVPDMAAPPTGCVTCHQPEGGGLEAAHPFGDVSLSCVDCHGGNPEVHDDPTAAHVAMPAELHPTLPPSCNGDLEALQGRACDHSSDCGGARCVDGACEACEACDGALLCRDGICCLGYRGVRKLSTDQLDRIPEEVLQFVNPGDHRVAHRGCGSSNGQSGETGCHQSIVETSRRSVMQTFAGHYNLSRYLTGMQDRKAVVGVTSVESMDHDEDDPLSVQRLEPLQGPSEDAELASPESTMDTYLPQNCPYCHTASFGKNDDARNYRSSGCTACHMLYEADGLSKSLDANINHDVAGHPTTHELTTKIPTQQCEHCHYQGARIGLTYQGVREGGFKEPPQVAEQHKSWLTTPSHKHPARFYISEEAGAPGVQDLTPPDIHCRAPGETGPCKMDCADCHVGVEVHGDGRLYSTAKGQLQIHCVDCHGTVRREATPAEGLFYTGTGAPLKQLSKDEDGQVWLTRNRDGERLAVSQIKTLVSFCNDPGAANVPMCQAMGIDENGFSHTDTMECWTCHTQWRMNCFGCHVRELSGVRQRNHQTGGVMDTLVRGERQYFDIDLMFLGTNQRGMIDTLCPSMQLFFSFQGRPGQPRIEQRPRRTADGRIGFGWMPNNQHTVGPARPCTQCHPAADGSNMETVMATFGFGQPSKQYFVAARNDEPEGNFSCSDDTSCDEGMGCLNSCPQNMDIDSPSFLVRRCATRCRSTDDCDYPTLCVRVENREATVLSDAGDLEGLCVYDLTRMLDDDGNAIAPFAHENTGAVSPAARQRAFDVTIE